MPCRRIKPSWQVISGNPGEPRQHLTFSQAWHIIAIKQFNRTCMQAMRQDQLCSIRSRPGKYQMINAHPIRLSLHTMLILNTKTSSNAVATTGLWLFAYSIRSKPPILHEETAPLGPKGIESKGKVRLRPKCSTSPQQRAHMVENMVDSDIQIVLNS